MANNLKPLALVLVQVIDSHPLLYSRLSDDFSVTSEIEIGALSLNFSTLVGDFVFSHFSRFEKSHLVFCRSDESANISFWKVV